MWKEEGKVMGIGRFEVYSERKKRNSYCIMAEFSRGNEDRHMK